MEKSRTRIDERMKTRELEKTKEQAQERQRIKEWEGCQEKWCNGVRKRKLQNKVYITSLPSPLKNINKLYWTSQVPKDSWDLIRFGELAFRLILGRRKKMSEGRHQVQKVRGVLMWRIIKSFKKRKNRMISVSTKKKKKFLYNKVDTWISSQCE